MSGFAFKLRVTYQDKHIEFKPFGNFALVLDETTKAFGSVESLVFQYKNLHNKLTLINNETDYIEMINNFTNELYYPDLEYADLQLVRYDELEKEESVSDNEEENEDDVADNDIDDESTRKKHSNKFNEQKRIYYIKEKKEMQREEQRKYDLESSHNDNNNERSKAKKRSKGK